MTAAPHWFQWLVLAALVVAVCVVMAAILFEISRLFRITGDDEQ